MRVAIVHDFLTQAGGAERVVLHLSSMYPDAPIFTSVFDADLTYPEFSGKDIRTSKLQGKVSPTGFRRDALRYPGAFRSMDLSEFDLVIASSSTFAHHIRHPKVVVYCYTPPRFLYDLATYVSSERIASVGNAALAPIRAIDRRAARRAVAYASISQTTRERVRAVYGIESIVINPPLWTDHLPQELSPAPAVTKALIVARLLPYKRVDIAIAACQELGVPLTVVGAGPYRSELEKMAAASTTFVGRVPDEEMAGLFRDHSVVLVPGAEDFGYSPIEANFAGRPVVAIAKAGPAETVIDGHNGLLVEDYEVARWAKTIDEALTSRWDPAQLRASTERYQLPAFSAAFRHLVDRAYQQS